jgi:hypothetical protein
MDKVVENRALKRAERSRVLKYSDPSLEKVDEYDYSPLKDMKRRIRLLRLVSSGLENPIIDCELFEVEFNENNEPFRVQDFEDNDSITAQKPVEYEALSWCWGTEEPEYAIRIREGVEQYKLQAKRQLVLALKYLRRNHKDRILWIDGICIDQEDSNERNHQVQMMSMIYNRAKKVCVWLGEDDDNSTMAIRFISEQIMHLDRFDSICKDEANTDNWQALLALMQRPWFRRRWVVQEIALARKAKIYCGQDKIPWKDFAIAVELFVEVESATHRLSEVIQKDERFYHVPGWFEYVSELGASLLVGATGKIFRTAETRDEDGSKREKVRSLIQASRQSRREDGPSGPPFVRQETIGAAHHDLVAAQVGEEAKTLGVGRPDETDRSRHASSSEAESEGDPTDHLGQRGLLSLEYLVSTLSTFEATEPRDAIYSLLAIARDTSPIAEANTFRSDESKDSLILETLSSFLERKPYRVDYSRPYSDVCKDFISFCISRSKALDPSRALDILCRPWALPPPRASIKALETRKRKKVEKKADSDKKEHKQEKRKGIYHGDTRIPLWVPRKEPCTRKQLSEYTQDLDDSEIGPNILKYFPRTPIMGKTKYVNASDEAVKDIPLPTWVASIEGAPFGHFQHPGMHTMRTGRKNADSLVGLPQDGHRNYSAAQTQKPEDNDFKLRFRKRPVLGHYSLYVRGFILDQVDEVTAPAYGGNIPKVWTTVGGWKDVSKDPPDDFLRTLVADRGKGNRNPPYYYAKACRESIAKGSIESGRVNTEALINSEKNSIITEFCRRVQEVIWNRRLIRTVKGTLGLAHEQVEAGDLICIIYGCSVPVILRRKYKADAVIVAIDSGAKQKPHHQNRPSMARSIDKNMNEVQELDKSMTDDVLKNAVDAMERLKALGEMSQLDLRAAAEDGHPPSETEGALVAGNSTQTALVTQPNVDWQVRFQSAKEDALRAWEALLPRLKEGVPEKITGEPIVSVPDSLEAAQAKIMDDKLKDELLEDQVERLKDCVHSLESRLIQRARYRYLIEHGFTCRNTVFNGPEYLGYVQKATKIVNDHLAQMKKMKLDWELGEREAKDNLAKLSIQLKKKDEKEEEPSGEQFEDSHYYYHVMGESYIHGMMDGEAIREKFSQKIQLRTFELR